MLGETAVTTAAASVVVMVAVPQFAVAPVFALAVK